MMSGISSKAVNSLENKYKANGGSELQNKEFSDGSGLELYDATFRMYDAQIGRFHQIDPLAGAAFNFSPYTYVQNNPLLFTDPLGLDTLRRNSEGGLPDKRPDGSGLADNDVIINEDGSVIYYNGQTWQPEKSISGVTVSNSNTSSSGGWGGFYWPQIRKDQGRWSDEMYARVRDNKPLSQPGDPEWLKDQIPFHQQNYKAEQEYRTNQLAALLIIATPVLIAVAPEIIVTLQSTAGSLGALVTDASLVGNATIQMTVNSIRTQAIRAILQTVPLSFGMTRALIQGGNTPVYLNERTLFVAAKFIISLFSPSGSLPPNNSILPPDYEGKK